MHRGMQDLGAIAEAMLVCCTKQAPYQVKKLRQERASAISLLLKAIDAKPIVVYHGQETMRDKI